MLLQGLDVCESLRSCRLYEAGLYCLVGIQLDPYMLPTAFAAVIALFMIVLDSNIA